MERINRRTFIRCAVTGTTALAAELAAMSFSPRRIYGNEASKFSRVVYRQLGTTGFKVSEIGLGAGITKDAELIHAAIDRGINYIETAHSYHNGANEELIGSAMKTKRNKVFLVTKVRWNDRTVQELRKMMEISLKRLKTDYVDTMYLHITDKREQILDEDLIGLLDRAKRDGLCRFAGVSSHENQAEVLDAVIESGFWNSVMVGYNCHSPESVTRAIQRARTAGIAVSAIKTLKPCRKNGYPFHPEGVTDNQAALQWVLKNPFVDTVLPGITTFDQLEEDIAVMAMQLSFDDNQPLMKYSERSEKRSCIGIAGCTGCSGTCPHGVNIRDLNRCVGYVDDYGDLERAQEEYVHLPHSSRVEQCYGCENCLVTCSQGLDMNRTIWRAQELFASLS